MWNLLRGTDSLSHISHARPFLMHISRGHDLELQPKAPQHDQGNTYHARPLKIKFGQVQSTMDASVET